MKKISYLIFLIFFFLNINVVHSSDNVYFIDLDFVLKNSEIGKNTLANIEKINNENIQDLQSKENELKTLENDIKIKQNIVSKEEFDKEVALLKEKINTYKSLKNEMVIDFNKKKNKILKNYFDKINPVIQEYMNENSIDILLETKNVFIGKNNLDITLDIINKVDKQLK